ncbi:MAG: sulfotransferase [Caulobacteraceae bacterium]
MTGRTELLEGVFAAVRSGDVEHARKLAEAALVKGVEHPVLLNLRALGLEQAGKFEAALADLQRAHVLSPKDPTILNACGLALARLNRPEEALACYDRAISLAPDFGQAWFNRGWALEQIGETTKAAAAYGRAAEIHPENAQAFANLAKLDATRGDVKATWRHAARALDLQPGLPTAALALAAVEAPAEAEPRLRELLRQSLNPFDRAMALGELGDVLDAVGKPAQAFDAYAASNAAFRDEARSRFEAKGRQTVPQTLAWLVPWAERLDPAGWTVDAEGAAGLGGERSHVFLLGFPRSGTTLIESFLGAHPDVVTLEERETLRPAVLDFMRGPVDMDRLARARGGELRRLRDAYWASVRSFGIDPAKRVFVDKNPFNTVRLPLIAKLFPHAKILFAMRDPRDVTLSCFRRRFALNPTTYEFLDLGRAAANYDATMRFASALEGKLGLAEHRLVYEDLVSDFGRVARAACEFIGADWREEMADFGGRARRGEVASASSAQIARGLYSDGAGQWRRYEAQLAPILPVLDPWVRRFGYVQSPPV